MEVIFSNKFYRLFDKYLKKHPHEALLIRNRIKLLKSSPNRENEYAISIDQSIRIIFSREKDVCYLLEIGSHDEVY